MISCPADRFETILEVFLCVLGYISVFGYIWYPESGCIQNPESGGLVVSGFWWSGIQNLAVSRIWLYPESRIWRSGGIWFPESGGLDMDTKKGSRLWLPLWCMWLAV
jgi:hypothetical protein